MFGILRYRTEAIRTRDLTYLFIVIGIAILNAVARSPITLAELLLVNGMILGITYWLEFTPGGLRVDEKSIVYDNLALLHPEREAELKADLTQRTGLAVERVAVERINLLRETADVTVFYRRPRA
ncbi:MAG: DUF4956 domain-containing protein [Polyangiales bacterium]|nr:DUF4956 domain-containing protein [Myxococcales bacterium]